MKVVALRFSLQAEEDLIEIWNYAAQYESRAADRLLRELETRLKLLSEYLSEIRHLVIGKYIAFYRVTEDAVVIARVLHGRRDITAEDMR